MATQTNTTETVGGKLKRLAAGILSADGSGDNSAENAPSATRFKAPGSPADETLSPGNVGTADGPNPPSVAGFTPGAEYPLSVSLKEASRGYGKAATGNKRLMYVEVDGWEGLAVCHVHDRNKWKPHQRLTGLFHRLTPDYMLEFACHPDCAKR